MIDPPEFLLASNEMNHKHGEQRGIAITLIIT